MTTAVVIGAGITGLAAAADLVDPVHAAATPISVAVWEASDRVGGALFTTAFGGVDHVDAGADAFLLRTPAAAELAARVGLGSLGSGLVSPEPVTAAVWHNTLHPIPDGIMLGVPASILPLARSRLLSVRGKLRAAAEPFLPRRDPHDSIGAFVRGRFGDEVHERLVDALIGSIYATDTDRSSLMAVPQLAQLASGTRSVLLGARRQRTAAAMARALVPPGPSAIFATPHNGTQALAHATAEYVAEHGGKIRSLTSIAEIEPHRRGWRITATNGHVRIAEHVVLACSARVAGRVLAAVAPESAAALAAVEYADVVMVRLRIPAADWPSRLRGRSGYLVPKPVQRWVTAASFASQKWAHWQPTNGDQILRISLGRDLRRVADLDDAAALAAAIDEVGGHLGIDLQPTDTSVTRWVDGFAQYRPGHHVRVAAAEAALPAGIYLAGASYRGIGIPACVADGRRAADMVRTAATAPRDFLA